ncbi:MAG: tryptophan synthase subunit alpha [Thermoplasmata archaeon YP2-bin.285]|uniref:Tryptophan synthase alpha chain n=1 Tax=Candidatus Sysuiplasma superficiale TaxID=2823368 RepID=A0A8J8CFL8_9ARCH|nr:tryptophan synthase subunit alpha [Candidatus Sysuiplasma superficiale]
MRAGRIAEAFARASSEHRAALISYIMGGDPDPVLFLEYARSIASVSDIIEIGIPFSDPIADGPVIQAASTRALSRNTRVGAVVEACGEISGIAPVVLMTYYNTVHRAGEKEFVSRMSAAGVSGLIVPDLPYEEGTSLRRECARAGVDCILLSSPSTKPERARRIAELTSGFLYVVSRYGVTGARTEMTESLASMVSSYRALSSKPVAVGFGISSPEQIRSISQTGADGIVVGSAIVSLIGKGEDPSVVSAFVSKLRDASSSV